MKNGPSQTGYLRSRLAGMALQELQEFAAFLQADYNKRQPGDWTSAEQMNAHYRLYQEVGATIRKKLETMLVLAHRANEEGEFDGGG